MGVRLGGPQAPRDPARQAPAGLRRSADPPGSRTRNCPPWRPSPRTCCDWPSPSCPSSAIPRTISIEAWKRGESILFEGAQATLLDIDHGTYPFVTSSNCSLGGLFTGTGLPPKVLDKVLGVGKAYTTRVGAGPFPSELFDAVGDRIREVGREFGTTTGRPRRCGWFDAPITAHACRINGVDGLGLMKLDVLDGFPEVGLVVGLPGWRGRRDHPGAHLPSPTGTSSSSRSSTSRAGPNPPGASRIPPSCPGKPAPTWTPSPRASRPPSPT